jgi:nitronate monooxygenase
MTPRASDFAARLGIAQPIIQAPMAGGMTTPELVAAVSNAGGLGSLGAAMLSPQQIRENVAAIRRLTARPFQVNLFVLPRPTPEPADVAAATMRLAPFHAELGLPPPAVPNRWGEDFDDQIRAVLELAPPVVSTHFAPPPPAILAGLKSRGIMTITTATTPAEAHELERLGVDAVVAQGAEAGGHRGSFHDPSSPPLIGTMALVPAIVDAVSIPVIAAGGIMDGRGIAAALALGASAAQLGTAFLACPEAGTHPLHKAALTATDATIMTRGVTGRHARGLRNRLLTALSQGAESVPDYRVQSTLSGPLRAAAQKQNRPEFMAMWAGQGHRLARSEPAAQLVLAFAKQARERLVRT